LVFEAMLWPMHDPRVIPFCDSIKPLEAAATKFDA